MPQPVGDVGAYFLFLTLKLLKRFKPFKPSYVYVLNLVLYGVY